MSLTGVPSIEKEPGHIIPGVWEPLLEYDHHIRFRFILGLHLHRLLASGKAKPVVFSEIFPLKDLSKGLEALERRETWGKVIVRIKDEHGSKL